VRIAFFSEVAWPMVSGVALTLDRTVRAVERRGHAARIYSATYDLPPGAVERDNIHRSPSKPLLFSPEVQWATPRQSRITTDLAAFRPDVVHCLTEFSMGRAGVRAARTLGVPLVASAHTDYEQYAERYGLGWAVWPGWHYLRAFYANARVVLAPTRHYQLHLQRRGVRHTGIWSRGVDLDEFGPRFRSADWRARFGVGTGDALVTHVGRIAPEKNVPLLLDAWGAIAERHPRAHLVFVGKGLVEEEIQARGLPRVHLAGMQRGAELAAAYASADLFVLPSVTETFGNVLLEAMASGVPALAAAAGGVLDFAVDGRNACLAAPGDAAAFASRLDHLLADSELRGRLADGGMATAASRGWGPVLDRLLADYARAAWSSRSVRAA
jgi:glycosyltransferase involved in cell wall biosynthesis